jgi:TonB family protein
MPVETERRPAVEHVEEPRVNPRGLFPGMSPDAQQTTSQGDDGTGANRGHEGGEESNPDAAGRGAEGPQVNLPDRSVVGRLPLPDYTVDVAGRVVVDIVVDSRGVVTNAYVRDEGTTTSNATLREAALAAARRSRFSVAENTPHQGGSITYIFRLR